MATHKFIAEDGTEMTFELVEEIEGCRRFKISVEGCLDRLMVLVDNNKGLEAAYNTLGIQLTWGMYHFESLPVYTNSIGQLI